MEVKVLSTNVDKIWGVRRKLGLCKLASCHRRCMQNTSSMGYCEHTRTTYWASTSPKGSDKAHSDLEFDLQDTACSRGRWNSWQSLTCPVSSNILMKVYFVPQQERHKSNSYNKIDLEYWIGSGVEGKEPGGVSNTQLGCRANTRAFVKESKGRKAWGSAGA